jgi:hypothetical protein
VRLAISQSCRPRATAFKQSRVYVSIDSGGGELTMIGNVVSDCRLLSLQAGEWLMLIVGGLAGLLILMF